MKMLGMLAVCMLGLTSRTLVSGAIITCCPGKYLSADGSCMQCPAGYGCNPCPLSNQLCSPLDSLGGCSPAPNITVSSTNLESYKCQSGKAAVEGSRSCTTCIPNTYAPTAGMRICLPCPEDSECVQQGGTITPTPCISPFTRKESQIVCTCDLTFNYQTTTTNCIPRTVCNPPKTYSPVNPPPSNADTICAATNPCASGKITIKLPTEISDYMCIDNIMCRTADQYEFKPLIQNSVGFAIQLRICRSLSICTANTQYVLIQPTVSSDRVCATYTTCNPATEFELVAPTQTSNRVCKETTLCDYSTQFLLSTGTAFSDNQCVDILTCPTGYFRSSQARNASGSINGTNSVCKKFSNCSLGSGYLFTGNETADVTCAVCPKGTYGPDGESCLQCSLGKFSLSVGAVACRACTDCSNQSNAKTPFSCPSNGTCLPAAYQKCKFDSDSVCTHCPSTWKYSNSQGTCEPCADGYLWTGSNCVACPANSYCKNPYTWSECPDLVIIQDERGGYVSVPGSPQGSYSPFQCNCDTATGFGAFQDSCRPCEPGTASGSGDATCTVCPPGKYSSQPAEIHDYRKCPSASSPVTPTTLYGMEGIGNNPVETFLGLTGAACQIMQGPGSCISCPPATPYTRDYPKGGASSMDACSACMDGEFLSDSGHCETCKDPCQAWSEYETQACVDWTDRQCDECSHACNANEYSVACPGPNPSAPGVGCSPCKTPPLGAAFVMPPAESIPVTDESSCKWRCGNNEFSRLGENVCRKCTVLTETTCPPGMTQTRCSQREDASCSLPCRNETKPMRYSEWAKTLLVDPLTGIILDNPVKDDRGLDNPNEGCMWSCVKGRHEWQSPGGSWWCIRD